MGEHQWYLHLSRVPGSDMASLKSAIEQSRLKAHAAGAKLVVAFGPTLLKELAPNDVPDDFQPYETFKSIDGSGKEAKGTQEELLFWFTHDRKDVVWQLQYDARISLKKNMKVARETMTFMTPSMKWYYFLMNGLTYSFFNACLLLLVFPCCLCLVAFGVRFFYSHIYWFIFLCASSSMSTCIMNRDDMTGFIDGTGNPEANRDKEVALVPKGQKGEGGSFVIAQRWIHDLEKFHALKVPHQEEVFGRTKSDSTRLEKQPPTSHLSHVELRCGKTGDATKPKRDEMSRRSTPYAFHDGTNGLYFMAFCRSQAPFRERMNAMVSFKNSLVFC